MGDVGVSLEMLDEEPAKDTSEERLDDPIVLWHEVTDSVKYEKVALISDESSNRNMSLWKSKFVILRILRLCKRT